MIKHLFKLVWNRKRSNLLLMFEIFFSFIVLVAVMTLAAYYQDNYRRPLGFVYESVWNIGIDMNAATNDVWSAEMVSTTQQLFLALQDFPEIESACGALSTPYGLGARQSVNEFKGRRVEMEVNEVTDTFLQTLNLQLLAGRWFDQTDDASNWKPVVINQRLSRELFGHDDPIGRPFEPWSSPGEEVRVIGVISDFRRDGEFVGPGNYLFERKRLDDPRHRPPANLLIKVRPGTNVTFEERLAARLQAVAREWSFEIRPLTRMREVAMKLRLVPVILLGLIAAFLMIMVGLGLVGVLWQNVTQRTKEIGLRRAKGATAAAIHQQILGETLVLTSLGVVLGLILVVQFPLLDLISSVSVTVYARGVLLALLVLYGLTLAASLYPSWLATKVRPAQALHYE